MLLRNESLEKNGVQARYRRLFAILGRFRSGPRFTVEQLASDLGVSRRTIFRDLDVLRQLNFNINFDGEAGGYRLIETHELPQPSGLKPDDIVSLAVSVSLSQATCIPEMAAAAREALSKVLMLCDSSTRETISKLVCSCWLEESNELQFSEGVLSSVLSGIRHQRKVRVTFFTPVDGFEQTLVSPYRINAGKSKWTLIGRSTIHRSTQDFNIAEFKSAEVTDMAFKTPQRYRRVNP
jgi:predicted DNA-binding transcriptional regulator YafY